MTTGAISLSDIASWVSKKFESDKSAPMLTTRIDSRRRMIQFNTAFPEPYPTHTPYTYVIEGRDPATFMPIPLFDFLFLDGPAPTFEKLMQMNEMDLIDRMTINRIVRESMVDVVEAKVVERVWAHLAEMSRTPRLN